METLHERLVELAEVSDERPDPGTAAAAAARGRAYRRRRLVGTASTLAACAAALAVALGVSWARSAPDLQPAPANAPTGIPRELYEPSPWLPGTGDSTLGVLAGILPTERGTWGGLEQGLVGVSATTGDYRFLDLPDAEPSELYEAVVSPDGTRVAYWTTGGTELSPDSVSGPVNGVAVYDSTTGQTVLQEVDTDHGLTTDELIWLDERTLLLGYGQLLGGDGDSLMDRSTSTPASWFTWRVGDTARETDLPVGADVVSAVDGRLVLLTGNSMHAVTDPSQSSPVRFDIGNDWSTSPLLDPSGRQVAYVAGDVKGARHTSSRNPNRVLVAELPRKGESRVLKPRHIPGSARTFAVVAWTDPSHVVLLRATDASRDRTALVIVDVGTGERRVVTTGDQFAVFESGRVAIDLLDEPPIAAPEPPRPPDPRAVTGVSGIVALSVVAGLILWRRRVPA